MHVVSIGHEVVLTLELDRLGRGLPLNTIMMRMGDLTLQPTAPIPPEIEGFLKKLKRKTRSLAGNWNKRWFFVDPRRREFGYADNRTSAPRSTPHWTWASPLKAVLTLYTVCRL